MLPELPEPELPEPELPEPELPEPELPEPELPEPELPVLSESAHCPEVVDPGLARKDRRVDTGIARPAPSSLLMAKATPTTSPEASSNGLPEFPGSMALLISII